MSDLVEFLRARLDEDEQAARTASASPWKDPEEDDTDGLWLTREDAYHIYRWEPARVLREVEAKRGIIDEVFRYEAQIDGEWGCCHDPEQIAAGECPETKLDDVPAFRLLTLPYADHPDYREDWRP